MYNQNVYKYDDMKRAEHMAVRETVGWYYFTHQLMEVTGPDATAFLDKMVANPIANLGVHRDRYTTMLDHQGNIFDDVVVMRLGEERYWVSTLYVQKMKYWFDANKGDLDVTYEDVTKQYEMFSVQGPKSKELLNNILENNVDDMKFFSTAENVLDGIPCPINRGGFTGEKLGYEIYVAPEYYEAVNEKLRPAAKALGGREVTEFQVMVLTLPAEKGFYLMRDLLHRNPFEVGLDRGIGWDKEFVGKEALMAIREAGAAYEMLGFTVEKADVQISHKCFGGPGEAVMLGDVEIGRVSKFTYSYVLEKNIGYALVRKGSVAKGDHVCIHGEDAVICDKVFI